MRDDTGTRKARERRREKEGQTLVQQRVRDQRIFAALELRFVQSDEHKGNERKREGGRERDDEGIAEREWNWSHLAEHLGALTDFFSAHGSSFSDMSGDLRTVGIMLFSLCEASNNISIETISRRGGEEEGTSAVVAKEGAGDAYRR
jgi:hypothetical protein